jgi:hypothetical protein
MVHCSRFVVLFESVLGKCDSLLYPLVVQRNHAARFVNPTFECGPKVYLS